MLGAVPQGLALRVRTRPGAHPGGGPCAGPSGLHAANPGQGVSERSEPLNF